MRNAHSQKKSGWAEEESKYFCKWNSILFLHYKPYDLILWPALCRNQASGKGKSCILNCTSNRPEICLPRHLTDSRYFDRRSQVPPLAAWRLPSASWAGGTEFAFLPVLVTVYNVLNWKVGFILRRWEVEWLWCPVLPALAAERQ